MRGNVASETGEIEIMEKGIATGSIRMREERWRITGMYVREQGEEIENGKEMVGGGDEESVRVVIGRDSTREREKQREENCRRKRE